MRRAGWAFFILMLAGCASAPKTVAPSPPPAPLSGTYVPLRGNVYVVFVGSGAGVVLADSMAVTRVENVAALDPKTIVGKSADFDLLLFAAEKTLVDVPTAEPFAGEAVVAYGQGGGALRMASGSISALEVPAALCGKCHAKSAFAFESNTAGAGFVGGPVLDAKSGRLAGMVFATAENNGRHMIYAFRSSLVRTEIDTIVSALSADPD
jgi:hypothetical protein